MDVFGDRANVTIMLHERVDVLVTGGGPAGMMAGLLLARAGVRVTVIEKHADFLRDFRGDTVHPSTLALFEQLGFLDDVLKLERGHIEQVSLRVADSTLTLADFRHLSVPAPFIAMMPQWDLLDLLARRAAGYPGFELRMETEAVGVTTDADGRISGVELADGGRIEAKLTIAADGRRSILRDAAELPLETLGAPMDVLWFRLTKPDALDDGETFGSVAAGRMLILIDRGDYYQCAFLVPKGGSDAVRSDSLEMFRRGIVDLVPELEPSVSALESWDEVKTLEVSLDRLTRWHRPGLLAIGDAAHAMSPIGGVGINVAVQDAVAMANILAAPLARGDNADPLLENVQAARWRSVVRMQRMQKLAQDRVIEPVLERTAPIRRPAFPLRLLDAVPLLRRVPGRVIGMGFDPQRIESPDAFAGKAA
ncbi:FAD-dependent oxidoreductase [Pseudoblastomonas halimionae]|nr:FAD-dependent oxidoreductase [Alteriqipengyuania halimionae]